MEKILKLNSTEEAIALYGSLDENLRYAEKEYRVHIAARNFRLKITGDKSNVEKALRFFQARLSEIRGGFSGQSLRASLLPTAHADVSGHPPKSVYESAISFFHRGKMIRPISKNQEKYLEAIRDRDIVFSIGPAGTGKTYLAVAAGIDLLKKKIVSRIILTRPAVEAGESLGFLPGSLHEKVDPYLRPLYDALYDMMEGEEVSKLLERGLIEIAPIAYMRGRTLNDCFLIVDEGQNCTHAQIKMLLTRLGASSKAVVTGDITQIDLPVGKKSGLVEVQTVLADIKGVRFCYLDDTDVVRHPLVQEIIKAYEKYERKIPNKHSS
ncbi:MAG: PhoH family protein [Candidatus Omnitrophica bacterium]|nr:PhoH family protein [Candidatus Omnitrophota bacterium]